MNDLSFETMKVGTEQINREKGMQKVIGLNGLMKMKPIITGFDGIEEAVNRVMKEEG